LEIPTVFGIFGLGPTEILLLALIAGGPVLIAAVVLYFALRPRGPKE
jgi:hypothetical protein